MAKQTAKRTIKVGAREANQGFSRLLREVESGTDVIITRNGRDVATLSAAETSEASDRQAKIARMWEAMEKYSFNSGGYRFRREDAYDDE